MVNRRITLILLLLFIITSCTLTTELPNVIKGRWAYSKDSDGIAAELYSFNDKMEYTHITTKIDSDGNRVQDKEYSGTYTMTYSSFEVLKASGTIVLNGQADRETENKTLYFTFEAKTYAPIRSLTLTNNNSTITYGYSGDAV